MKIIYLQMIVNICFSRVNNSMPNNSLFTSILYSFWLLYRLELIFVPIVTGDTALKELLNKILHYTSYKIINILK